MSRIFSTFLVAAALLVPVLHRPAGAQWRSEPLVLPSKDAMDRSTRGRQAPPRSSTDVNHGRLVAAALAGSAAGAVGGAVLGYNLDYNYGTGGGDDPGLMGLITGWFFGPAIVTPIATHLANGRRGSLESSYLAAAAITGVSYVALLGIGSPAGIFILLGSPAAQVVSSVTIETNTTTR